jgi:hypothetical protein
MTTTEASQRYLQLYQAFVGRMPVAEPEPEPALDVNDVLYGLMNENQRLGELSKLTGKLRYAVDGHDARLTEETVPRCGPSAGNLPEKYHVANLIDGARMTGAKGQRLSQLYVDPLLPPLGRGL